MSAPFISVVIPTYNASKFLREALDSLLAQTFTDWEAICVNDGSTDDSLSIMQEYAAKDSRFRILDGPNGGYGKAMNRGLDTARGVYTSILEPDDFTPRHAYTSLATAARQFHADVVRGEPCYFYENGDGSSTFYEVKQKTSYHRIIVPRTETDFFLRVPHTWCCLYRLDYLREHHIRYNETPGAAYQDTGMFFLSTAFAERVVCIPDITYCYRTDNPNSSINNRSRKGNVVMDEFAFIRAKLEAGNLWTPAIQPLFLSSYLTTNLWIFAQLADDLKPAFLERLTSELQDMRGISRDAILPVFVQDINVLLQGADAYTARLHEIEARGSLKESLSHGLTRVTDRSGKNSVIFFCGLPIYRRCLEPGVARHFFFGLPLIKRIAIPVYTNYEQDFRYIIANRQTFYLLGIPVFSRITKAKEYHF